MYEQLFQLRLRPFRCFPVVDDYYPARSAHQALGQIKLCLDRHSGTAVVIGEAGLGKTMILTVVAEYQRARYQSAHIQCSQLVLRTELLQTILFELGQPYRNMSEGEMRLALMDYIRNGCRQERGVLLLVDDAHRLSPELLAELGAMSNLVWQGTPRCQLVLAGNQHLDELLAQPELESCNQRVAARCYLSPLTSAETADYVRTHMKRAGSGTREFFNPDALGRIHQLCQGVPRLINMLCDHALILLATLGGSRVDQKLVENAWTDVQRLPGAAEWFQQENKEQQEPWSVIEFGELDASAANTSHQPEKRSGYHWKQLEADFDEEAVEAELRRLEKEQEDLIRHMEAAAIGARGENDQAEVAVEPTPPIKRIVNPFEEGDFDFEEQIVAPALRFTWKHNHTASALHPDDLTSDFPWPNYEFDLSDSVLTPVEIGNHELNADVNPSADDTPVGKVSTGAFTLPLESSLVRGSAPAAPPSLPAHQDDSDLLVVSRVNQYPSPELNRVEERAEPGPPSSVGRAVRMEYELLFDRLRGMVKNSPANQDP